jgi:hypothetical protein
VERPYAGTADRAPVRKGWTVSREVVDEEAVRLPPAVVAAAVAAEQHRVAGTSRWPVSRRRDVVEFVRQRTEPGEAALPSLTDA